jgi:hypothetical protein
MTTIPVRCPEKGCGAVVQVDRSRHDDYDGLVGLECPKGHRFDYDKTVCPKCGATAYPADHRPEQAWFGNAVPGPNPVFKQARCTQPECGWEGPKS